MARGKIVADDYNAFRRRYFYWGKPQRRIIREAWISLFTPDGDADIAFDNRVRGYVMTPQAEIDWIESFNPLSPKPALETI